MRCLYCNNYCSVECREEFYECYSCDVCFERFDFSWNSSFRRTFTCKDLIVIEKKSGFFLNKIDLLFYAPDILIPNLQISKETFKDKDKLHRKLMTYLTFV
jgi:hypothetical protein